MVELAAGTLRDQSVPPGEECLETVGSSELGAAEVLEPDMVVVTGSHKLGVHARLLLLYLVHQGPDERQSRACGPQPLHRTQSGCLSHLRATVRPPVPSPRCDTYRPCQGAVGARRATSRKHPRSLMQVSWSRRVRQCLCPHGDVLGSDRGPRRALPWTPSCGTKSSRRSRRSRSRPRIGCPNTTRSIMPPR